jgi:hypothetical protein
MEGTAGAPIRGTQVEPAVLGFSKTTPQDNQLSASPGLGEHEAVLLW